MTSVYLALFVLALGLGLALLIYKTGDTAGWSDSKIRNVSLFFAIGGVLASIFVYTSDKQMRETTLFEVVVEQPAVEEPKLFTFEVRSPTVEHSFLYAPVRSGLNARIEPVTLQVSLKDSTETELLAETHEFEPYRRRDRADEWRAEYRAFTPTKAGTHQLTVTRLAGEECNVHLRVADPTLTDGERAPGY